MMTNDYSISIQLASDNTISSSKYYDSQLLSLQDFRKGFEEHNETRNFSTGSVGNSVSNICETFVQQERNSNVNLAYCVTPMAIQLSKMPPPPHNSYSQERNEWQNNKNEDTQTLRENKYENSLTNGNCRYKFQNTFYNSTYRSNEHLSEVVCNSVPVCQHNQRNGTGNYNKNRYISHNGKRQKRGYKRQCPEEIVRRVHGLMERFTSRVKLFKIDPLISYCTKITQLDRSIWELFYTKAQTQDIYLHKLSLWKKLFLHVTKLFDRYGLFMVGSTMSGLATKSSDIDLCLLLRSCPTDTRADALHYLDIIRNSLLNCDFAQTPEVIHAKVPILKFKTHHGFEIDLNCNNAVGIRNTHLLHCYTQLDWRVRPLVIIVKLWAQANGINDAKNMTISSYSLALMVIHFLQCGVIPPVIPCLHGLYPDKFNPEREIHDINIQEELPPFVSDNKQNLGELLQRFLYYYATFNYEMYAISVRVASRVLIDECRYARSSKNDPHQWKYLCIEEPFDLTNTARSVYDLLTFKRIQRVFQVSSNLLLETENLSCILMIANENQR